MSSLLYQVCSAFVAIFILLAWTRPCKFRYLMDKDRDEPSLGRIGQFTAMAVSTWGFATLVITNDLNEWFFTGYMLVWAGAQATSLLLKIKGSAQPGTTVETTSANTVKTVTP